MLLDIRIASMYNIKSTTYNIFKCRFLKIETSLWFNKHNAGLLLVQRVKEYMYITTFGETANKGPLCTYILRQHFLSNVDKPTKCVTFSQCWSRMCHAFWNYFKDVSHITISKIRNKIVIHIKFWQLLIRSVPLRCSNSIP